MMEMYSHAAEDASPMLVYDCKTNSGKNPFYEDLQQLYELPADAGSCPGPGRTI